MMEQTYDPASINSYTNSYHTLSRVGKVAAEKRQIPPLNSHLFLAAQLSTNQLRQLLQSCDNKLNGPIFSFPPWTKFKAELKSTLKKTFHVKLKQIAEGNILIIPPGDSINIRADYFCLAPHEVYTVLAPLQKCDMASGTIAVSQAGLKWKANSQEELLEELQHQEFRWEYANLEGGDLVMIGRDCVYGSFRQVLGYGRNDSKEVRHYAELRMVKYEQSSSSSNSS